MCIHDSAGEGVTIELRLWFWSILWANLRHNPLESRINVSARQRKEMRNAWEIIKWKNIMIIYIICKNCMFYIMLQYHGLPKTKFPCVFHLQTSKNPRNICTTSTQFCLPLTFTGSNLLAVQVGNPGNPRFLELIVPQPRASRIGVVASLPDMTGKLLMFKSLI